MAPTVTPEPSDVAIAVTSLINAIGALLIALNVGLTQTQTAAIGLVLNAAFGVGWSIYKAVRTKPVAKP